MANVHEFRERVDESASAKGTLVLGPPNWKFFGKTRITSDKFLFSRFYRRNDQNVTEPFASAHSRTLLLGEIRGLFPKILVPAERTFPFDSTTEQLFCSWFMVHLFHTIYTTLTYSRKKSITTDDYKIKINTVQIIKCVWWSK